MTLECCPYFTHDKTEAHWEGWGRGGGDQWGKQGDTCKDLTIKFFFFKKRTHQKTEAQREVK